MNPRIPLREIRERLEIRRADLVARRDEARRAQLEVTEALDVGDAADGAVREQELTHLQDLTDSESRELRAIDAANARIEDGSYGTCFACEEEIDERRLLALPHTMLCVACAEIRARETELSPPPSL